MFANSAARARVHNTRQHKPFGGASRSSSRCVLVLHVSMTTGCATVTAATAATAAAALVYISCCHCLLAWRGVRARKWPTIAFDEHLALANIWYIAK